MLHDEGTKLDPFNGIRAASGPLGPMKTRYRDENRTVPGLALGARAYKRLRTGCFTDFSMRSREGSRGLGASTSLERASFLKEPLPARGGAGRVRARSVHGEIVPRWR